jgi:hypothetical protein
MENLKYTDDDFYDEEDQTTESDTDVDWSNNETLDAFLPNNKKQIGNLACGGNDEENGDAPVRAASSEFKGWNVNPISVAKPNAEFPTLVTSNSLVLAAQAEKPKSSFTRAPVSKWKNITAEFFKEDDDEEVEQPAQKPKEEQFTQVRRSKGHDHVENAARFKNHQKPKSDAAAAAAPPPKHKNLLARGPKPTVEAPATAETKQHMKNTRMCTWGASCKRSNCNFAHTLEEYTPVKCKFQSRCNIRNAEGVYDCRYIHDDESKQDFLRRTKE